MSEKLEQRIFLVSLGFICVTAVFAYGVAVGVYKVWPYRALVKVRDAATMLLVHESTVSEDLFVKPARGSPRKAITIFDQSVQKGYYAFLGWDNPQQQYSVWLYNDKGQKLYTWKIDYESLDPDSPVKDKGSGVPHGLHIMPDGSLIVGFSRAARVMARLDACGEPVWIKHGVFHHEITEDDDGAMWVWRGKRTAYGNYQYIVRFDPGDGATLEEIDLIRDIIRPLGAGAVIFGVNQDFKPEDADGDYPAENKYDIFHPNKVGVLSADLAPHFPEFKAGDLLLSLRNLNLVAVVDPVSKRLKWWSEGPWRRQHDPDFTADGKISVYDNNPGRDGSAIIKIDPATRTISNDLARGGFTFYSEWLGDHQYLPNGDVLVLSSGEGRVDVLSANGKRLFEFNNVVSDEYNGFVINGMWLPGDYFEHFPSCP
jgi:hypothetical protein